MPQPYAAALGTFDYPSGVMYQSLSFTPGGSYILSFDLLASALGTAGMTGRVEVTLSDGASITYASGIFSAISPATVHNGAEGFLPQNLSFSLPENVSAATLTIRDVSPNGGIAVDPVVDNFRLTAVPEPQGVVFLAMSMITARVYRRGAQRGRL